MIIIRTYQASDYPALRALYEAENSFGGQFDEDRDSEARVNAQSATDPNSILIAEEDNRVVGSVSLVRDRRFALLMRFAIAGADDTEVAGLLLSQAMENLKELGHDQVLVYAPDGNDKFIERYGHLGFEKGNPYTAFWRRI